VAFTIYSTRCDFILAFAMQPTYMGGLVISEAVT